jgi:JmjC domain
MSVLEFDTQVLKENFSEAPFSVKHTLVDNPLLNLDRLAQLADSLPETQVEHNLGDVPEFLPGGEAPRLDASPGEIARGIETNGCWMVLKRVESDPEYRDLLEESLSEVIPHVADQQGGATQKQGFIFLTAPNSTTPVHFDPEQNLLLQVKAKKQIDIGHWPNEEAERQHLEAYYGGAHRNLEAMPPDAQTFMLEPGDGVHVPLNLPHWVKTFDEVSISFSITFNTRYSESLTDIYSVNARMRKLHLSPRPPGERSGSDKAKAALWRSLRRGKRAVRSLGSRNGD